MNEKFIRGLELSQLFFEEVVEPMLARFFPDLPYSAALLGQGSEVLGYDTPRSMDHDWGPRLQLFLTREDLCKYQEEIDLLLRQHLPAEFRGFQTNFGNNEDGTTVMAEPELGLIHHRVKIYAVGPFFEYMLRFDPTGEIRPVDWVSVPENHLLMLTAGGVFHDGLGQLEPLREKLTYYPDDVWLYLLAVQWQRISQEEHFMGRCGQVNDDLGSRLVASRLVHDLMNLCFLMEQKYAPYIKWFGSAFSRLDCAGELLPVFTEVLRADTWEDRQEFLSTAYEFTARMHNELKITEPLITKVTPFFNRPFMVVNAGRFVDAIRGQITDKAVLGLPENLGSFDQFVDSTDALKYIDLIKSVYAGDN